MSFQPEYRVLEKISWSQSSVVYRVEFEGESQIKRAIVKTNAMDHPTLEERERMQREYNLGCLFKHENIIKYQELRTEEHRIVLVIEDFGARGLDELIGEQGLSSKDFLSVALQITRALALVHRQEIVHKDIKPRNIVINPETGVAKLIDFGISSRIKREFLSVTPPEKLEGTIPYISPEQTGRMNRAVDYRTDFYSLGVTFYEMLTGKTPFRGDDRLEVIHSHISKTPVSPEEIKKSIPQALSGIVLKLMSKNAEDRYQSCGGLLYDLEICQKHIEEGIPVPDFTPGKKDVSDRFMLPQKLYGRESEIEDLLELVEKTIRGETKVALVSGYSGVGKTALINEIHKPLTGGRGSFIEGKVDQFNRKTPFAPFVQAFRELILNILAEDESEIERWKKRILAAVSVNGQVIVEVIPEVEILIGPQPEIAELGPVERQNRFRNVFGEFTRAFAHKKHPLIIFIDDLQWADQASLELMETLLTAPDSSHLAFLGAYRDNEVDDAHPLLKTLERIGAARKIKKIAINPISAREITHLTADALHCEFEEAKELANLVHLKTAGNPFFTGQFLMSLYQDALLEFDHERGGWVWDLEKIKARDVTDNVVELISRQILRLEKKNRDALAMAAGVGERFHLKLLAVLLGISPAEAFELFAPAVQAGLLLTLDQDFGRMEFSEKKEREKYDAKLRFLHDRVQQAAYHQFPEEGRPALHLHIGRTMLKSFNPEERDENLFLLLEQFNSGYTLIDDLEEKQTLAELNLKGGQRARDSAAYLAARGFLSIALNLLPENHLASHYQLSYKIYTLLGECEFLLSNIERGARLFETAIENARTDLERSRLNAAISELYTGRLERDKAFEHGVRALKLCGVELDLENPAENSALLKENLARHMEGREISELIDLPEMKDPGIREAMSLIYPLSINAFQIANVPLFASIILTGMNMSLKYGMSDLFAFTCAYHALLLVQEGRHKEAFEFTKLVPLIINKYPYCRQAAGALVIIGSSILPYYESYQNVIKICRRGYRLGLDSGELIFAVTGYGAILFYMWSAGYPLNEIREYAKSLRDLANKLGVTFLVHDFLHSYFRLLDVLEDISKLDLPEYSQTGEACFPEEGQWERIKASGFNLGVSLFNKTRQEFLYRRLPRAKKTAEETIEPVKAVFGYPLFLEHKYYYALILTGLYNEASKEEQEEYKKIINECLGDLRTYAQLNNRNFFHMQRLVEAELSRIENKPARDIWPLYQEAIVGATECKMLEYQALGNELFAYYWFGEGLDDVAQNYLAEAHYLYQFWGAAGKVKDLEESHPELLRRQKRGGEETFQKSATDSVGVISETVSLDVATVLKTSQAISRELSLENLLARLMEIIIENAGAQKGFLILPSENSESNFRIEASIKEKEVRVLKSIPLEKSRDLSRNIIRYTLRTGESQVLEDARKAAQSESRFAEDPYIKESQPLSVLAMPIRHQDRIAGALYLENNLSVGAFTRERTDLLNVILAQAAISLENAGFYKKLKESEKKYRSLYENAVEGIYQTTPRGLIIACNPALARIAGYDSPEELIAAGVDIAEQFYHNPEERESILQKLAEENQIQGFEAQAKRKDGSVFWCSISAHGVKDAEGNILYYEGSLIDVTGRKDKEKAEREREAAQAASVAKSEFLANMSHEIRTPMNGVVGMTELLMTTELTPQQHDYAEAISGSADALLVVLNDILDFSKIQAGKLTLESVYFDFRKTAEQIGQLFSGQTRGKDIDVLVRYPPDVPTRLLGDPTRLRQILSNLIGNAVKFTEAGHILVRVICEKKTEKECTLQVLVSDTGIGIPANRLDSIFDQFSQADASTTRKYGGTGLGLAICGHLVELMNGKIGVESTPGVGSTFWFRLTLPREETREVERETEVDISAVRILVVDDNAHNRTILQEYLTSWNIQGVAVSSAKAALEKLYTAKDAGTPFDIVVLDYFMPEMNGGELSRAIKTDEGLKETELILLSSGILLEDLDKTDRKNFAAALSKPIRISLFQKTLNKVWNRRRNGETAKVRERKPAAEKPAQLNAEILLVEDSRMNQRVAAGILQRYGCTVDVVDNGLQALEQLQVKEYQMVFMDGHMPVMDGFEATEKIRQMERGEYTKTHVPIIAMTALAMEGDRERCLSVGMDDYISKPVKSAAVLEVLLKYLQD